MKEQIKQYVQDRIEAEIRMGLEEHERGINNKITSWKARLRRIACQINYHIDNLKAD
jgi:hypothetical protein